MTHVVSNSLGTDKVRWAKAQPGVHAVSLEWLTACAQQWMRCDEAAHPVVEKAAGGKQPEVEPSGQLPPPQLDAAAGSGR